MTVDTRARDASVNLHAELDRCWPTPPPFRTPAHRRAKTVLSLAAACATVAAGLGVFLAINNHPSTPSSSQVVTAPAWRSATPGLYRLITSSSTPPMHPTDSILIYPPVENTQYHSFTVGVGDQIDGTSDYTTELSGNAAYLLRLTVISTGNTITYQPKQPALSVTDGSAGQSWSWSAPSLDGRHMLQSDTQILRRETITIGGRSVLTIVLKWDLTDTTTGYSEAMTKWYAPAYGQTVREVGTGGVAPTINQWSIELASLSPATP